MVVKTNTKQQIITALILLMLTSLFVSRVLLTISTVLFFVTSIVFYYKSFSFKKCKEKQIILGFGLIFFIALFTFFNSTDKAEWWNRTLVKLPFILLIIPFLFIRLTSFQIFTIHHIFIMFVFGGTIYTMSEYYLNSSYFEKEYQYARVLPTILDNDHIRFSWCVVIATIIVLYQHFEIQSKKLQWINLILGCWFVIFLHILGSKTGLLMLYIALVIYSIKLFVVYKNKLIFIALAFLCLSPIISYKLIPTFKKRVDYMLYDFSFYSKGKYKEGASDGARVTSIKAGYALFKKNLIVGIGYGDVQTETNEWYTTNVKFIQEYERILPSSQFVIIAAASGVVGLFAFLIMLSIPIFVKTKKSIYFFMFYLTALLSLIFEIHLESQFGVFIFCFFTLWFLLLTKQPSSFIKK